MSKSSKEPCPGPAAPQRGEAPPIPHKGWYLRNGLPHFDAAEVYQFITYRLADSLPTHLLQLLKEKSQSRKFNEKLTAAERKQIEQHLDAGHGSCMLRESHIAACVEKTWQRFHGERYELIAWVVMPNHVHVLIRQFEGWPLSKIVNSWKSYTARRIREFERGRCDVELHKSRAGARRSQGRVLRSSSQVWARGYWDRFLRDEKHFNRVVDYIHMNPAKANLCKHPSDWPHSSFSTFHTQ